MKKFRACFGLFALTSLSFACSSPEGEGTVIVTAYGESFIEDGIPASAMADEWEIEFERFDVTIDDVGVGGQQLSDLDVVDLTNDSSGDGHELGALLLPVGDYTHSSFSITHVELEGQATKGDETKTFHWTFHQPTHYSECETTTSVEEADDSIFQITVHADHLFYNSLASSDPELLFGPLAAADEDDDGEITEEELSETDIGDYDPGSEDGIDDLWVFLNAQAKTLGHVDGEGHCHAEALD